ncbi:hypothetical protein DES53_101594 [Roseimicrobium gellanilyticum]|uniref:Glyoxalase/bleomycin resistance protein/dioxygenase superfamily protein n=1 Tax=Roseimicrobium gellanilyticum TaxID=748857 RepID=A0A366HW34_9BACT|nr:hypothetical protein [Roseimicrobium gellanilyticum]RBP47794.1 hypothetical protein DES53_101594 [Roseimicrobium gellanilyticum]
MIHHASFSARNPETAARGLARLFACEAIKAPAPPFPQGSWFVCLGDASGTILEILPWGHILWNHATDKGSAGKSFDEDMREHSSTHFLIQTPLSTSRIEEIAKEEGWDCFPGNAGFFQFTKVWVEGTFLIELMTPVQAESYAAHFGQMGIATLDGKMRNLERAMQATLQMV